MYGDKRRFVSALMLFGVSALCIGYIAVDEAKRQASERIYESLRETAATETEEIYEPETETEAETEEEPEIIYCRQVYDFDELRQQNEDIYAWIVVPGTQVDYPVLSSDEDNYYLEHNIDGSTGYPGCIYTNSCNSKDFSDYNTVFYGHNMKNGSMFGCLHSFETKEFFDENDSIIVYTENLRLTYEIFTAIKYDDKYIPAYYDVKTLTGTKDFLASTEEYLNEEQSHLRYDFDMGEDDRMITLSTCVSGERPRRYLILGRLTETAYYEREE
jgi:sortase B